MPFKSKAQIKMMFATHPAIAKKWAKKYGVKKGLPEHVGNGAASAAAKRKPKGKGKKKRG
jgi:hypothetical protein